MLFKSWLEKSTFSGFFYGYWAIVFISLQIQLVGPIGPGVLDLLPSSVQVPSSSVIQKDEVHLIMEVRQKFGKILCLY